MEPGHEDREYTIERDRLLVQALASMEPGHEDREYVERILDRDIGANGPQWSPVMKTGNTPLEQADVGGDRVPQWSPVMKTGNTRPLGEPQE